MTTETASAMPKDNDNLTFYIQYSQSGPGCGCEAAYRNSNSFV